MRDEDLPAVNPYERPMVETTHRVLSVLEDAGIPYWLDCGTLLGLVRGRHIIPWDHDVEAGAWLIDKHRVDVCRAEFERRGLIITVDKPDKLGYQLPDGLPYKFRLLFYTLRGDKAVRGSLVGPRRSRLGPLLGHALSGGRVPGSAGKDPWYWHLPSALGRRLPARVQARFANGTTKLPAGVRYTFEIPARLFDQTRREVFYEQEVWIPAAAEEYLTFRYGTDWNVPTRYWVDGADHCTDIRHK